MSLFPPSDSDPDRARAYGVETRELRCEHELVDVLLRARETAARVACGAFAKQLLSAFGVSVRSHVIKLGSVPERPLSKTWEEIAAIPEDSPLNCGDAESQIAMIALIENRQDGDGVSAPGATVPRPVRVTEIGGSVNTSGE